MAILDYDGSKMTPKEKAASIIHSLIENFIWEEWLSNRSLDDLTDKEKTLIDDQYRKYRDRIIKLLGYEV